MEEEPEDQGDSPVTVLGMKSIPDKYTEESADIALTELPYVGESSTEDEGDTTTLMTTDSTTSDHPLPAEDDRPQLKKTLNLFNTVTIVVGSIIGSGIFITPTTVLFYAGSFGMALVFWVIGGVVAIAGGLIYVELGSMIKDCGGDYAYLREGYSFGGKRASLRAVGNTFAFLSMWSGTFLIRALSNAIISKAFAVYLCQAFGSGSVPSDISTQLVAVATILTIGLINMVSVKLTASIINVLAVVKVLALVFIVILGIWQLIKGAHLDNFKYAFEGSSPCPGDLVLAFYSISFTYSGWSSIGYIAEESKNAEKNLVRGIYIGVPIVTASYILVNIAYYAGLSKTELLSSPATALTFGQAILGRAGLVVIPLFVACSTFGSNLFAMFAGPRMSLSAARDGNLPEVLALIQNTSRTPVPAIALQCMLALVFVFSGSIRELINGEGVIEFIGYTLAFMALIIMRFTKRKDKRPFKVWIIIPVLMMFVTVFLIVVPIALVADERLVSLLFIGIVLLALPIYLIFGWERIRPKFLNRLSEAVAQRVAHLLDASSTRVQLSNDKK